MSFSGLKECVYASYNTFYDINYKVIYSVDDC